MLPALRRIGYPVVPHPAPEARRRARPARADADAAGLGRPRADQHQPAAELDDRLAASPTQVPRAIDAAFRIYMLPQGMFSVAVATVLFPQLARLAARGDYAGLQAHDRRRAAPDRAAADPGRRGDARARRADGAARLRARRVRRRVDQADRRGAVLVRLQPPVQRLRPDAHARVLLAPAAVGPDDAGRRLAGDQRGRLLRAGRAAGDRRHRARHDRSPTSRSCVAEAVWLRRALGGFETRADAARDRRRCCVGAAVLGVRRLRRLVGARRRCSGARCSPRSCRVGAALVAGAAAYAAVVLGLQIPEARQIVDLFAATAAASLVT